VVTFDPHPSEVVRPGTHPAVLTSAERKAELIEGLGVNVLCVIPFTGEFSRLSPETFVHDVLVEHLHATVVVVGENFRFGHRAAGDMELLTQLGQTFGFSVEPAPLVKDDGTVFSSTYIRSQIDAGEVGVAAGALGRPHRLEGIVVRGDRRGRSLGFPTANVEVRTPYAAVPADGVYAGWIIHGEAQEKAAISVGTNPTFAGRERRVEAYVLDFEGDLYGERVAVEFAVRLREMRTYHDVAPLIAQMNADVDETRRILTV
jgi:riboflavin kinase/FMN adenylyltransferase